MSSLCVVSINQVRSECGFHNIMGPSSKLLEIVEPWRRGLGGCSIPDRVASSQSDPLRNRSVLLLGSGELLLRAEGLVALLNASSASILQILFGIPSIHAPVECLFHQPVHGIWLFFRVQLRGRRTGIVTIVVVSRLIFLFVSSSKVFPVIRKSFVAGLARSRVTPK